MPVPVPVPAVPVVPVLVDEVPVVPAVPVEVVAPVLLVPVVLVESVVPAGGVSPAAPDSVGSVVVLGGLAVGMMSSPPEIDVEPVEPAPAPAVFVLVELATAGVVGSETAGTLAGAWYGTD